ncbi:hypothetical protein PR048_007115 [Dryococelus australis]|uniref:Wiskott-Aldrich syndrome protein family member n=1 Tax=Dryococelus australis TaxID=614101 RepID=A0ABQ9ICS5_9NEOP|nr:hypothetical protein PR048_007115 [Dryococelus australis]
MPLPKRVVEPVHVSRGTIPEDFPLPSELEAVTNGTLANTVRQLSSLSRHAEDMFGELAREAHGLVARANSLQARIDRLAVKVTQLDSNVEEVSLQDIHMRKAFKSAIVFDQQVVSRDTMPTAMLEMYQMCDKPPPLDKLNCYREDGKRWAEVLHRCKLLLRALEAGNDQRHREAHHGPPADAVPAAAACGSSPTVPAAPHRTRAEGGGGRHKKRVRQPQNTREHQRQLAVRHGEYIMPQNIHYRTPQVLTFVRLFMLGVDSDLARVGSGELQIGITNNKNIFTVHVIMHCREFLNKRLSTTSQSIPTKSRIYKIMSKFATLPLKQCVIKNGFLRRGAKQCRPSQPHPICSFAYTRCFYRQSGYLTRIHCGCASFLQLSNLVIYFNQISYADSIYYKQHIRQKQPLLSAIFVINSNQTLYAGFTRLIKAISKGGKLRFCEFFIVHEVSCFNMYFDVTSFYAFKVATLVHDSILALLITADCWRQAQTTGNFLRPNQ